MSDTKAPQFDVTVNYNGVPKKVRANPNQAIQALLQQSLNEFGIKENRENFGLFTTDGVELDVSRSVEEAGVDSSTLLLLRPRRVSGGK